VTFNGRGKSEDRRSKGLKKFNPEENPQTPIGSFKREVNRNHRERKWKKDDEEEKRV